MGKKLINESLKYFEELQKDYFLIIKEAQDNILYADSSIKSILSFIDEIKIFWLKRMQSVRYHLDIITDLSECFLLSGAIYLDTKHNGHYLFKTLGDHHIISDPFLKLETIFRANIANPNQSYNINYFNKVITDIHTILSSYSTLFYILPIHLLVEENKEEHLSLLDKSFWMFISGIFPKDYTNQEEFYKDYNSFDKIEKDINNFVKDNLIFFNANDAELPLFERIDNYCKAQSNLHQLLKNKSDVEKFILSLHNYIYQVMDILLTCTSFNLVPYIRFEVTFRYLSLVMHTFKNDRRLKDMIERAIIFYVLYLVIDRKKIFGIEFTEYCKMLYDANLLNSIIARKVNNNIDIIEDGVKEIKEIIIDEINKIYV